MSDSVRRRARWLFVVLVAAVICYYSVFASPDVGVEKLGPLGFVGRDKWFHAAGYAVFAASIAFALSASHRGYRLTVLLVLAIAGAVGFGIAMEFAQLAVPLRHTCGWDVVADAVGAVAGVLAVAWWWYIARRDEADLRS